MGLHFAGKEGRGRFYVPAIPLSSEALQIWTDPGDKEGGADALPSLPSFKSEYPKFIPLYSEVLSIHADLSDEEGRTDALQGLADVHCFRGWYDRSDRSIRVLVDSVVEDSFFAMRQGFRHQNQAGRLKKAERTSLFVNKLCNQVAGDTVLAQCFADKKEALNEYYLIDFMDAKAIAGLFVAVRDSEGNLKLVPKMPTSEGDSGRSSEGKATLRKEPIFKFPGILVDAALLPMKPGNEKDKKDERLLAGEVKALTPMLFGDLKTIRVARRLFSKKDSIEGRLGELQVDRVLDPHGYLFHGRPYYLHTAANSVRYGAYTVAQASQGDEIPEGEQENPTQNEVPTLTNAKYEVASPQEFRNGQIVEVGITIRANLLESEDGGQARYKLMPLLTSVTQWVDLTKSSAGIPAAVAPIDAQPLKGPADEQALLPSFAELDQSVHISLNGLRASPQPLVSTVDPVHVQHRVVLPFQGDVGQGIMS
ncbi:hypothetical protein FRC00_013765 [Tulasnella sp. 408]|nr:hypothetical protein FRC00_013765 [Tulasnella sp. 408]